MGTTFYSHAILGVAFQMPETLETDLRVPSCSHVARIGNDYCPKCGTKVEDQKTLDVTAIWQVREEIESLLPHNYELAVDFDEDDIFYYLGYGTTAAHDSGVEEISPPPHLDEVRGVIREIMTSVGLGHVCDMSTFQFYCFVTAS